LALRHEYDNDNKRIAYHLYDADNNAAPSGTILYTYNPSGLLNTVIHKGPNGQVQTTETFTYGSNENPTSMLQSISGGSSVSWQYSYPDNQVLMNGIVSQSGEIFMYTYNFDDNKNLLSLKSTGSIPIHLELGNYD